MEQLEKPKKAEFGPADDYTKNFILEKGGDSGYRKVAREIGAVPATLQQVVEQRNKAGRDTITKLYLYYKDFDLVMAMTGKPGGQPAIEAQVQTSPITIQDGVDWQSRFNTLEKKYDALFAEYQSLVAIMASKLKMSFNTASSHTTAEADPFFRNYAKYRAIGFEYGQKALQEATNAAPVMKMYNRIETPIIRLNSLAVSNRMQA